MAWAMALSVSLAMWDTGLGHHAPALEVLDTDNLSGLGNSSSRIYRCAGEGFLAAQRE